MGIQKTLLIGVLVSAGVQFAQADEYPHGVPCGTDVLNDVLVQKLCLQKDFTAKAIDRPSAISKFFASVVSGGHGYLAGNGGNEGLSLDYTDRILDMQGHVWDFSKQEHPGLVLGDHDSVVKNGIILNAYVDLSAVSYFSPNFESGKQKINQTLDKNGFLYADNYFDCLTRTYGIAACKGREKKIENLFLKNMRILGDNVYLNSWGGGIHGSQIIIRNQLDVAGSKATILNNQFWANAQVNNNKNLFTVTTNNQSKLIDKSTQIFPDRTEDKKAIPSVLYVKFSPDTVIDGNTFTLTHKNDQAYAIVLDHSLRVRITNNTFNGFKVPILMDQWSSIVDDKGNVLKPDQFAGDVEMNRKGEILRK